MTNTKQKGAQNRQKQKASKKNQPKRSNVNARNSGGRKLGFNVPSGPNDKSYLAAQLAPFSSRAFGARVPDDIEIQTCTCDIRANQTIGSDSGGGAGAAFRYHIYANYSKPSFTSGSITAWGTPSACNYNGAVTLGSVATAVRTVGFGIRVTCTQPMSTMTGNLHVALVPDAYAASNLLITPASISALQGSMYYQKVPAADLILNDIVVAGRVSDASGYRYYQPQVTDLISANNTQGTITTSGWMSIVIIGEGLPASLATAFEIDVIHHVEFMPQATGNGFSLTSNPSPCSPLTLAGVKNAARNIPPTNVVAAGTELGDNATWWSSAMKYVDAGAVASTGLSLITNGIAGMAMGSAGPTARIAAATARRMLTM